MTEVLSEKQRIELIIEAILYVQKVKAKGMPSSSYSKALREPIFFLWENYGKGDKYDHARYASLKSKGVKKGGRRLVYDHAIPFRLVQEALLALEIVSESSVKKILEDMLHACVLTREEDQQLTKCGLRSKMPLDWDEQDVLARYKAAEIDVSDKMK